MKVITNPSKVPNAGRLGVGFVYKDPDSGKEFVSASPDQLAVMAIKHRKANNYPIGSQWSQDFIDNVCANTPGEVCHDELPPSRAQKAKALTLALIDSARGGFKTCTEEEVEERKQGCQTSGPGGAACQHFRGFRGMFGVSCALCGCAKLKLHLKTSKCGRNIWREL